MVAINIRFGLMKPEHPMGQPKLQNIEGGMSMWYDATLSQLLLVT